MFVCMYVRMYVRMHVCMCVHPYVCMHVCTCACMYVCTRVCILTIFRIYLRYKCHDTRLSHYKKEYFRLH